MNREIKFRAWDKQAHDWNKANSDGSFPLKEMIGWEELRDYEMDVLDSGGGGLVIMQFTGLKDKSRKEIYEGDILLFGNAIFYQVVFGNGSFRCVVENGLNGKVASGVPLGDMSLRNAEVIGNIFQNPDLIAKGGPQ